VTDAPIKTEQLLVDGQSGAGAGSLNGILQMARSVLVTTGKVAWRLSVIISPASRNELERRLKIPLELFGVELGDISAKRSWPKAIWA
jgi:hypothetical protein